MLFLTKNLYKCLNLLLFLWWIPMVLFMGILEQTWQVLIWIGNGSNQIVGCIHKFFFWADLSPVLKIYNFVWIFMGIRKKWTVLFMLVSTKKLLILDFTRIFLVKIAIYLAWKIVHTILRRIKWKQLELMFLTK